MRPPLLDLLVDTIKRDGPITFERFMDVALYHPDHGYYTRSARRTGRLGDFLTSVDVGPVFGELLARQFAEMQAIIAREPFDLVEAAASNGQLSRDVLDALAVDSPAVYASTRAHLVEASAAARQAHRTVLGRHASKLAMSAATLPNRVHGVIFANELLDALPCHAVVMRADLREVVVDAEGDTLVEREGPLSTPAIAEHLSRLGVALKPGWRGEVNLRAVAWVRDAARRLARGFLILIDYGHRAPELYSASHRAGTRASHDRHVAEDARGTAAWLRAPGEVDITAHVDLTSIERAAAEEGLTTIAMMDQTYFLLGLGLDRVLQDTGAAGLKRRLALKTLMLPGGLGSTLKVMIFGRGVGTPPLLGCSYGTRLT